MHIQLTFISVFIVLSHADFHVLEKQLEQKETWEQVVGLTCFGGATWQLRAASV